MTKLKKSNGDKTKKLELGGNSKVQIAIKLKKNTDCDQLKNSNCDKTKKTQIVTKLKNWNCDKKKTVVTVVTVVNKIPSINFFPQFFSS